MDRNQEQQQHEKPAQGAPATTYATNVRVSYRKLFNYGLTNDANGDLVIDDPNDKDLYPDQVDRVEEPFVAAPDGPEPIPKPERPSSPSQPPQQAESTTGDQLSDWYPIPAPGQYGQAPESQSEVVKRKEDHNPQEYAEDLMWEDEEAPDQAPESQFVYDRVDQEMEDHEQQEDAGNVMLEKEKSYEGVLGPISTEDLVDFDDHDMFIDWLYQGAQEQDGEVAPEEDTKVAPEANENEEELEKEEDEQEQEKVAETATKLEDLEKKKKKTEEEELSLKLIEQMLKQDQFENRMRTLRNRGRLENPKKKLSADEEKAQKELRKKAKGHKLHEFEEGISNDRNAPEIEEILRSMGMTLPRVRPEERRRRRYKSGSDDENCDPEESRQARRKQQAKRRKHNN